MSRSNKERGRFNTLVRISLLSAIAFITAACASAPRVFSNVAPVADFDRYRTFSFAEKLGTDNREDVRSLLSQYLIIDVSRQLESRGYQFVEEDADLIVDFAHITREKLRSTPAGSIGGYYGYGPYPGYGYYGGYGDHYRITQYTEGTLSIAVVDAATNGVVWEGINIARITDDVRDNMAAAVTAAVDEIFARFPFEAPAGTISLAGND